MEDKDIDYILIQDFQSDYPIERKDVTERDIYDWFFEKTQSERKAEMYVELISPEYGIGGSSGLSLQMGFW